MSKSRKKLKNVTFITEGNHCELNTYPSYAHCSMNNLIIPHKRTTEMEGEMMKRNYRKNAVKSSGPKISPELLYSSSESKYFTMYNNMIYKK